MMDFLFLDWMLNLLSNCQMRTVLADIDLAKIRQHVCETCQSMGCRHFRIFKKQQGGHIYVTDAFEQHPHVPADKYMGSKKNRADREGEGSRHMAPTATNESTEPYSKNFLFSRQGCTGTVLVVPQASVGLDFIIAFGQNKVQPNGALCSKDARWFPPLFCFDSALGFQKSLTELVTLC